MNLRANEGVQHLVTVAIAGVVVSLMFNYLCDLFYINK
jgi:hypothetical protein